MHLDKWNDFLATWAEALKGGYNIPVTFVCGAEIREAELEFGGKKYPFVWRFSPGYSKRKEFMEEEKKRKEHGSYLRCQNNSSSCFLCDNIGQAIASKNNQTISNNSMYDMGDFVIFPNKYPGFLGHSLFIPKEHDDIKFRVQSANGSYLIEEGKTRGAIITPPYLESLVQACNNFNLAGVSNHVLDSMSIPEHKHFHLLPEDLRLFSLIGYVLQGESQKDFDNGIYQLKNTPFDTLVIEKRENSDRFIEKSCSFLKKMEEANEVFTLLYTKKIGNPKIIISPRKGGSKITENVRCGGGTIPIHCIDEISPDYIQRIKKYVPEKGEYDWGRFI